MLLLDLPLPDVLGPPLDGPTLVVATSDDFQARVSGEMIDAKEGFSIVWVGPAPAWTLCADKDGAPMMRLEFFIEGLTKVGGGFGCDLDWYAHIHAPHAHGHARARTDVEEARTHLPVPAKRAISSTMARCAVSSGERCGEPW